MNMILSWTDTLSVWLLWQEPLFFNFLPQAKLEINLHGRNVGVSSHVHSIGETKNHCMINWPNDSFTPQCSLSLLSVAFILLTVVNWDFHQCHHKKIYFVSILHCPWHILPNTVMYCLGVVTCVWLAFARVVEVHCWAYPLPFMSTTGTHLSVTVMKPHSEASVVDPHYNFSLHSHNTSALFRYVWYWSATEHGRWYLVHPHIRDLGPGL